MNVLALFLPALVAALIAFGLTPLSMRLAALLGAVDHPGPRKVHATDIPRLGGLAVIASVALVAGVLWATRVPKIIKVTEDLALGVTLGLIPVLVVSIYDDLRPLHALPKALAQFAGAGIAVSLGMRLNPAIHLFDVDITIGWLAIPLSILWIVGVTNAFNLVDGLDGLSAGLALISAMSLAGVSVSVGRYDIALIALILGGALVGFLPYNLHPAKTFLGDSGATAIGFCLACLALRGGSTLTTGLAILAPLVVLGLPVAETLVSMARRLLRRFSKVGGSGVFEADGEHFHHRLLKLGITHQRAVMMLHGVGLLLAAIGVGSMFLSHKQAAVLLLTIIAAGFIGLSRLGYDEFAVIRRGDMLRLYDVPVLRTGLFVVFADIVLCVAALYVSWVLKYDDWGLATNRHKLQRLLAILPIATLGAFYLLGLYRRAWKVATVGDIVRVVGGVFVAAALLVGFSRFYWSDPLPITFYLTWFLVASAMLAGMRASYRVFSEWSHRARRQAAGEPVLIYGAGFAGALAVREILENDDLEMRPIGFLDDDASKLGRMTAGYPVLGSLERLEELVAVQAVRGLVIASGKIGQEQLDEAARLCERSGIWMKVFRVAFDKREAG
ncbi:MAG: hypothetical protein WC538_24570 [Thermoanaerobaculia bacterium]|jgi:UDP-GlcNAc:undecaprenyl-phosphate GlcNAc-1-phosphate transferase